ncbi:MAG: hypothetical protein V1866_02190 [archaeon]
MKKIFDYYKRGENGAYVIEMRVSTLEELFSPYDPSPLHDRDIHPSLMGQIFRQIVVFPKESRVELHIHLPKKLRKQKLEPLLEQAIKSHFEYELLDSDLHLQRRLNKGWRIFSYASMLFVCLLLLSYLMKSLFPDNILFNVLSDGFAIGAWVSLWHPFQTLFFDWLPLYEEKKKFSRLKDMKIEFKYF